MSFDEALEELLKKAEEEARKKVAAGIDEGHNQLIRDIKALLSDAESYQFHDMLNERFAAPKGALADILHTMRDKAINGSYDNN